MGRCTNFQICNKKQADVVEAALGKYAVSKLFSSLKSDRRFVGEEWFLKLNLWRLNNCQPVVGVSENFYWRKGAVRKVNPHYAQAIFLTVDKFVEMVNNYDSVLRVMEYYLRYENVLLIGEPDNSVGSNYMKEPFRDLMKFLTDRVDGECETDADHEIYSNFMKELKYYIESDGYRHTVGACEKVVVAGATLSLYTVAFEDFASGLLMTDDVSLNLKKYLLKPTFKISMLLAENNPNVTHKFLETLHLVLGQDKSSVELDDEDEEHNLYLDLLEEFISEIYDCLNFSADQT